MSCNFMSCNFVSCIFMSCIFMPCNFMLCYVDGPLFSCPLFLRAPSAKPLLESLHSLPMRQRVTYKLANLCFKTDADTSVTSATARTTPSLSITAVSYESTLAVPRTRTVFTNRVFSSLHREFGTHCRTMSSTRTPCQL